jgi:hypothetical protein
LRVLASLWFIVALAIGALGIAVMVDLSSSPICADARSSVLGPLEDCYDISSSEKAIALLLGWPGSLLAILSGGLSVFFAITGRLGRSALILGVAAVLLCAITVVVA